MPRLRRGDLRGRPEGLAAFAHLEDVGPLFGQAAVHVGMLEVP